MKEITIQLTEKCNLSCSYCFAGSQRGAEISADDLKYFMEFCAKNGVESIHVTGGEPTLYSNFANCIEELAKKFYLVIYSNFTVQDTIKKLNLRDRDLIFLVNINPRENKCENCSYAKFLFGCGCPIENSYKVEESLCT